MFSKIGVTELLIILAIALLIFGPKALPKLGKSIGRTVGNFKKGLQEEDGEEGTEIKRLSADKIEDAKERDV